MSNFIFHLIIIFRYSTCIVAHEKAIDLQQQEVITNMKGIDGFGGQMLHIIITVVYAELHNKKFCYRPFEIMEHNYDNDPNFIARKEWLLNFIGNFETIDEAIKKIIKLCKETMDHFFIHI
jgi:hypothetical protein